MGWTSPFEFFKRSLLQVNKIDCCKDILIASGYRSCDGQAGVTRIIIGTLSFRTLLKTFGIMKNGEKHKDSCGTNFVGRHLLPGSTDSASTKSKSWFDEIIWKQINLSLVLPSVGKFFEMTRALASILRSPNCFLTPNLLSRSVCCSKSDPTLKKKISYFFC